MDGYTESGLYHKKATHRRLGQIQEALLISDCTTRKNDVTCLEFYLL